MWRFFLFLQVLYYEKHHENHIARFDHRFVDVASRAATDENGALQAVEWRD